MCRWRPQLCKKCTLGVGVIWRLLNPRSRSGGIYTKVGYLPSQWAGVPKRDALLFGAAKSTETIQSRINSNKRPKADIFVAFGGT